MEAPEKIYLVEDKQTHKPMDYWYNSTTDDSKIEYIRKDALVKYLFEKKGYPITLNGELVHWDELTKHLTEYNNWKKDAFIEKAKNWLYLQLNEINMEGEDMESFLKDFKNYMK